jgi:hypothetical protein
MSEIREWVEQHCLDPDKDVPRHFERIKVRGEWRYQATSNIEHPLEEGKELKIAYQEDRRIDQRGRVVSRHQPSWYTRTTKILYVSPDERFFLIGVRLMEPVE